jgi:hypothetical protein
MEENKALRVVDGLRDQGVDAHLAREGVYKIGVRVVIGDGREALWDTDDTPDLEAQVMRDGVLVGFVPHIPGSEEYEVPEVIAAIAGTDYDQPIATRRAAPPPQSAPLPKEGGLFRRFLGGFRER